MDMDKYIDTLKQKHFPVTRSIGEFTYSKNKKDLPEDEFNLRFFSRETSDSTEYYEIISESPQDNTELMLFLLDQILVQQDMSANKLGIISGILIFSLICSLAAVFISLSPLI
jgi:hypothetical protein